MGVPPRTKKKDIHLSAPLVWRSLNGMQVPNCSACSGPMHVVVRIMILAWLLQAVPAVADQPVETEFSATASYANKPVTLHAELNKPDGKGPFPAVVLMHGCGGLQPAVKRALRTHADFLVNHGFVTLILDSFGPRENGDGWVCKSFDRLMAARRYRTADALDAFEFLKSQKYVDSENIFQMGQSNGGSVAIRLAQLDNPVFRASAAYYPWCGTFNRLGSNADFTSPLIVLAGTDDDWTPIAECQNLKSTRAEYQVIAYPGAVHSFDLEISRQTYQGHAIGYDETAAVDSRRQMTAFFYRHLTADRKAAMPTLALNDAAEIEFLSGAEIQQLLPSGKLRGVNGYGNPYTVTYSANGLMRGVAGKGDEYRDTGKWWIEGDKFCRQYQSWLDAAAACFRLRLENSNMGFYDKAGDLVSSGNFK
jgi:dienelactone hydrolase